jgi:hypothetical protein
MIYIPLGQAAFDLLDPELVHGNSGFGAGVLTGSGLQQNRPVRDVDLRVAEFQGQRFAELLATFTYGRRHRPTSSLADVSILCQQQTTAAIALAKASANVAAECHSTPTTMVSTRCK